MLFTIAGELVDTFYMGRVRASVIYSLILRPAYHSCLHVYRKTALPRLIYGAAVW
jgi:hypothetical protein